MEPTPNHHDDASSKRRRLDQAPTPESVNVKRYVATLTSSPQRQSPNLSPHDDANSEDGQTQNDLPFTQDPALLRPTDVALSSPERSTDTYADPDDDEVATPPPAFETVTPLDDIDPHVVGIIKDTIKDVYGFTDPRPFQIESVNHLAFKESSLVY